MITADADDNLKVSALNAILVACEQAVERKEIGAAQRLAAQSPDFEDEIAEFFRCHDVIQRVANPVLAVLSVESPLPTLPEYESLEEVGRGGMGIVYKGRHRATGRIDAVKVISPGRMAAQTSYAVNAFVERFRQECRLAAQVAHQNIVPVYHVGENENAVYYSMRFIDGPTLSELIQESPLDSHRAARYIEQLARAVNSLHQHGILHGDIKPHNILIDPETDTPLLTDFGLADVDPGGNTEPSVLFLGTPGYIPPEAAGFSSQGANVGSVGPSIAADVYGLGATLYTLLTGVPPHPGQTANERMRATLEQAVISVRLQNDKVPMAVAAICEKALASEPNDRFQTASELAESLALWMDRPNWAQHFPNLGQFLFVVAPLLLLNNIIVFFMLGSQIGRSLAWIPIFMGYIPLFFAFAWSGHEFKPSCRPALRELWLTWIGHCAAAASCYVAMNIMFAPHQASTLAAFYVCLAAISSLAFFVKSANFWNGYLWIGAGWATVAIVLAMLPEWSPLVFGICAATTACIIAIQELKIPRLAKNSNRF